MGRPFDEDLRWRVIAAIRSGMSARAAARRFAIGESTAGKWMRAYRAQGHVRPKPMGRRRGSKLDPHAAFIFGLIENSVDRDVTLDEIVACLADERGVSACRALVGRYLLARGMTFKKRQRTPPSRIARMSAPPARPGSTLSPSFIPTA